MDDFQKLMDDISELGFDFGSGRVLSEMSKQWDVVVWLTAENSWLSKQR